MKEFDPADNAQKDFIRTYASATVTIPKETWEQVENTEPDWKKTKTKDTVEGNSPQQRKDEIRIYTDGSCPENSKVN